RGGVEGGGGGGRAMRMEKMGQGLDQRFRLLPGGSRTALPRQQTLRSLIDWSYNLLTGEEQALLCRLSVFAGGWTLGMAEQVCSGEPIEDWEVLDLLTSLADKSLAVYSERGGSGRYRLLETVRQYALERLVESPDTGAEVRLRHATYFLEFARERLARLRTAGEAAALQELEADGDNLWSAWRWSADQVPLGAELAFVLGSWRQRSGFLREAVEAIEAGIALVDPDS